MKALFPILVVSLVGACGECGPVENPQSAEYPCGPKGISCGHQECCWQGEECGGPVPSSPQTCPDGMCCWIGPEEIMAPKPNHQKLSETAMRSAK
jgi:hypothetical protein